LASNGSPELLIVMGAGATPDQTEARLLRGLHARFPELAGSTTLAALLRELRRGRGVGAERPRCASPSR